MIPILLPALALAILGLWLAVQLVQATQARTAARAAYFDAVTPLFSGIEERIEPTGFPRLTALHYVLAFDLQGTFYVKVVADNGNTISEYGFEDNNVGVWDTPITVVLNWQSLLAP